MRTLHAAAAVEAVSLALSSCSPPSTSEPAPTATPRMSLDDDFLTVQQDRAADGSSSSATARLTFPLSFEDGCVRVGGYTVVGPRPASGDG